MSKSIEFRKDGLVFQFQMETSNTKTGNLVQNYILPESWLTTNESISRLSDKDICFDCPHSQSENKTCYVRKGNSFMGLMSKVRSLRKKFIPEYSQEIEDRLIEAIAGRGIRFGAYGEPVLLGEELISKIAKSSKFWTGYTHQWHKFNWAKDYFMASVESNLIARAAEAMGFRTFFVGDTALENYVTCPASKEAGKKAECADCKMCMGTQSKAKNIKILKH